jgi:putative transposase
MPSRLVLRNYHEGGIYHVFNRGLGKMEVFKDSEDYNIFLYYLRAYLLPYEAAVKKYPNLPLRLQAKNLSTEVKLISFCIMPNHFHLLLKQTSKDGISKLLKQINNAYTLYFNNKYKRSGPLFNGKYKAVETKTNEQLIHIVRYIHLNPVVAWIVDNPKEYKWSSHTEYLKGGDLCDKTLILKQFSTIVAYEKFILDQKDYGKALEKIKHIIIES